ncbi:MAG: heme ABC transporter ATP-binding protein [Gammaproteobacteria bacterium]|nr:heme ABC transporter ATP-binding protein [Gammaproteobacteria bacterium]|tara:strand:- start:8 stop:784 length:777 start_codon:yes stop_codon:yes gene_type:complete
MTLSADELMVSRRGQNIIDGVDISLELGNLSAVIGPNGAGKSTLLSALAGDLEPTKGSITVDGKPIEHFSPSNLAKVRSVMYQSNNIVFDFLVEEILIMGWIRDTFGRSPFAIKAVSELAEICGVSELLGRSFLTLSGGEKQRVQFCRALVQLWRPDQEFGPRYLLLDEPTSNLDVSYELGVLEILKDMTEKETGVLVVLHDLNLASYFSDRIYLMNKGRVFACGEPSEVIRSDTLSDVYGTPISVEDRNGKLHVYTH